MNLHNLPNVIGEQRKLLKAIADAEITSDDMLKLYELDPEFGKLASIAATIYSKLPTTTDTLKEFEEHEEQTVETAPTQREEWVPATKLRNMYPLAYGFIRNRVDLSAGKKEEIWDIFKKENPEYSISQDEFYRLMRLVINIRTEKAREINDKVDSALTASPQKINETLSNVKPTTDETVDKEIKEEKVKAETKDEKDLKDPSTNKNIAILYPLQYSWLRSQQIDYLKKNTVTSVRNDFEKRNPRQKDKCGRTTFGRIIKLVIQEKTNAEPVKSKAPAPEPIGQFKEYPKNPGVRFFENGCVQCLTKEGNWTTRKITVAGGYTVITYQGKTISIAKAMLETFKPMSFSDGKQRVPYYKDGNKLNCHIDNLSWDLPATKPTARQIHEACKIIASNINGSMESGLNIMASKGEGVQNHALESILKGEYTSISEKYFTLQNGKPVLNQKETKTGEVPASNNEEKPIVIGGSSIEKHPAQSSVEKLIDTINYKKLMEDRRGDVLSYFKATKNIRMAVKAFEAKMELKMTIDSSDKIIPVLEFSLDKEGNLRNPGDVLKDITRKYGNLYITQNYVKDILTGKIGKEYSDLVFK